MRTIGQRKPCSHLPGHALCAALMVTLLTCRAAAADDAYRITERIPAASKYWDYGSLDPQLRRFYVGRIGGVLSLDLLTGKITEPLFEGKLIHGVIPIPDRTIVVAADGAANELKVFDTKMNKSLPPVHVGGHPDAVAYDRQTDTVITVNKQSQDLTLVSASTWEVLATIPLHGDPEFAATDNRGMLYVNIADQGRILSVDLASKRIVKRVKLKACEEPGGMAYDAKDGLLVSACHGVAKFVAAHSLQEVASIAVGNGADAVIWDSSRSLVFIPAGDDGVLNIIKVRSRSDIASVGKVATEMGARSGAVDETSGRVYLASGRTVREPESKEWHPPAVVKDSFHILVIAPEAQAASAK